jgi:MYXO-CTERM domain-containing protein
MKHRRAFITVAGSLVVLLALGGASCSSVVRSDPGERVATTAAAVLEGNGNYYITAADPNGSTGTAITGLTVTVAVTQDVTFPSGGMGMQLNAYSPSNANVVWQQYVIEVTPPTLWWEIEDWPTNDYDSQLGIPAGGSFFALGQNVSQFFPNLPSGNVLPAGYVLVFALQNDSNGNVTGSTFSATNPSGVKTTLGPAIVVGSPALPDGGGIPESAIAPIYAFELNLVGPGDGAFANITSGAGTITYAADQPLYASMNQPSWTAAQGVFTAESSTLAYGTLPAGPSNTLVQPFGVAQCCESTSSSPCVTPTGSYTNSCTGCAAAASGSACVLTCASCGTINGTPNANPSVTLPCGNVTNGEISNSNGSLVVNCFYYVPAGDGGTGSDGGSGSDAGLDSGSDAAGPGCTYGSESFLESCSGCTYAPTTCGTCTLECQECGDPKADGGFTFAPSLTLPCAGNVSNDYGTLVCSTGAAAGCVDAGSSSSGGGGSSGGTNGSSSGASGSGSSSGAGSSSGMGSNDGLQGTPASSSGCACTARGEGGTGTGWWTMVGAGIVAIGRRRRRVVR